MAHCRSNRSYRIEAEITHQNAMTCIVQVRLDDLIAPSGLKSYELWIYSALLGEFQNTLPTPGCNPLSYCEPATASPQHPKSRGIWVLRLSLQGWALPIRELHISEEQLPDFICGKFSFYTVRVGQRGFMSLPGPRAQNPTGLLSSLQKHCATSRQMSWRVPSRGKVTSANSMVVK